jgi:hypothetical protein
VLIISLVGGMLGAGGAGAMPVGFRFSIGMSFATADNFGANNVKPKIPKTVVKPITKDFRFDLGIFLYFSRGGFN